MGMKGNKMEYEVSGVSTGNPDLFSEAVALASEWHHGQMYGVFPYVVHCVDVGAWLVQTTDDPVYPVVGVLHDIIEDTSCPYSLITERFGERVADMVLELARCDDEEYLEYVDRLSPDASVVKYADNVCNLMRGCKESLKVRYVGSLRLLEPKVGHVFDTGDGFVDWIEDFEW